MPGSIAGRAGRIEQWLVGLTLFMFTEAFVSKMFAAPTDPALGAAAADENALLRYLWLPFYGFAAIGLVLAGRQSLRALLRSPLLILLCALAMASTIWSILPDMSLRRGFAVTMTTVLGLYIAARYGWTDALRIFGAVWAAVFALTLVAGIVAPSFAVMSEIHVGAWAGGWFEKNQLGGHAARAVLLFAFLSWRDERYRNWWIAALVLALVMVKLSTSATALVGSALAFAVLVCAWWMQRGKVGAVLLIWFGVVVVGLIVVALMIDSAFVLKLIGRDATLTGRTDIWDQLARAISEKPWLGYGYQAFWAPGSDPRYWLQQAVDWPAPTGHNGWLDLAISLGLVGLGVFVLDFVLSIGRAVMLATRSPAGIYALGALAQLALFSMSESILLYQNSIIWVTYVFVSAKLAMGQRQSITPESTAPSVGVASTQPESTARWASSLSRL